MDLSIGTLIAFLGGLIFLYFLGMLLVVPIKIITKLIFNGVIGGVVLILFNLVGGLFGFFIPINPLSAVVVGILGIPGVILLLILQMIL